MNRSNDSRNRRTRPRDPEKLSNLHEIKHFYRTLVTELDECHRLRRAMTEVASDRRLGLDEAKRTVKKQSKQILTISKRQKAQEEMKKAGAWSGAAAVLVVIMYEIFKVIGFPGGYQLESFWKHEAVYGVFMTAVTYIMGWCYKTSHPEVKG